MCFSFVCIHDIEDIVRREKITGTDEKKSEETTEVEIHNLIDSKHDPVENKRRVREKE